MYGCEIDLGLKDGYILLFNVLILVFISTILEKYVHTCIRTCIQWFYCRDFRHKFLEDVRVCLKVSESVSMFSHLSLVWIFCYHVLLEHHYDITNHSAEAHLHYKVVHRWKFVFDDLRTIYRLMAFTFMTLRPATHGRVQVMGAFNPVAYYSGKYCKYK